MFERIKPTTQIRTVALPGDIANTLQYVYLCNKIEKRGIIIKGNHGAFAWYTMRASVTHMFR